MQCISSLHLFTDEIKVGYCSNISGGVALIV